MSEVWITLVVALIAASPGWLAWWNQRRRLWSDEKRQNHRERRQEGKDAIQGFSELFEELRLQRIEDKKEHQEQRRRDKADCEHRIQRVREELLEQIVNLETQLQEATNGTV